MQLRKVIVGLGSFVFIGALIACSSSSDSSSGSSGSATCPKVGDKVCPNDQPVTQAVVDLCNKCIGQANTFAKCQGTSGSSSSSSCDSSGKSTSTGSSTSAQVKQECNQAITDYFNCILGGSSVNLDGGTGG